MRDGSENSTDDCDDWFGAGGSRCRFSGACSVQSPSESVGLRSQALSSSQQRILGFESVGPGSNDWTTSSGVIAQSVRRVEGSGSLAIANGGNAELKSAPLSSLGPVADKVTLDVLLPAAQPNPTWMGTVKLVIECPSPQLWYEGLAEYPLQGRATEQFLRFEFPLSASTRTKLSTGAYSDLRFKVVLNVASAPGPWLLDRLWVGDPVPGAFGATVVRARGRVRLVDWSSSNSVVVAHEFGHVLLGSGHTGSSGSGNLMAAGAGPEDRLLTGAQCVTARQAAKKYRRGFYDYAVAIGAAKVQLEPIPVDSEWLKAQPMTPLPKVCCDVEFFVWGVTGGKTNFPDAYPVRYEVVTDSWMPVSVPPPVLGSDGVGAPVFGYDRRAYFCSRDLLICGVYSISDDTWDQLDLRDALPRFGFWPAWAVTDHELILFGSPDFETERVIGASYDFDTEQWKPLPSEGAPDPLLGQSATWVDDGVFFWGGAAASKEPSPREQGWMLKLD